MTPKEREDWKKRKERPTGQLGFTLMTRTCWTRIQKEKERTLTIQGNSCSKHLKPWQTIHSTTRRARPRWICLSIPVRRGRRSGERRKMRRRGDGRVYWRMTMINFGSMLDVWHPGSYSYSCRSDVRFQTLVDWSTMNCRIVLVVVNKEDASILFDFFRQFRIRGSLTFCSQPKSLLSLPIT